MQITFNIEAIAHYAVEHHMDAPNDFRWSVGKSLEDLFPEQYEALIALMEAQYNAKENV